MRVDPADHDVSPSIADMVVAVVAVCVLPPDVTRAHLLRRFLWQQGVPVRVHQDSFAKYVSCPDNRDAAARMFRRQRNNSIYPLPAAAGITTTLAWTLLNSGVALSELPFVTEFCT